MDKKLKLIETPLEGSFIIKQKKFKDKRGSFSRVFCQDELKYILRSKNIKQINHSFNKKAGTFRGFHFQYPPFNETKIVKCVRGKILDIIIDIRKDSKTFLKSFSIELSAKKNKLLLIPNGFAHGFLTLHKNSEVLYMHTELFKGTSEGGLNVADPKLNINLLEEISVISKKDKHFKFITKNFKGIKV